MDNSNLWPSLEEIMKSEKDSPMLFLRQQGEFLKNISAELSYRINEDYCFNAKFPLDKCKIHGEFPVEYSPNNVIDASFQITRKNKIYTGEILRIRYTMSKNYPIDVYDCCNGHLYRISSIEEFEQCLSTVFNSSNCMAQIRYILSDAVA